MAELKDLLSKYENVVSFEEMELAALGEIAAEVTFAKGEMLFHEQDMGDSVYLLDSGSVELFTSIRKDLDQTLLTVRTGGFIGALAMLEDASRDISARAAEPVSAYRFEREKLSAIMDQEQSLGVKLLRLVNDVLSKRLRIVMQSLRQNLEWTMQVSGLATLDIGQLIVDRVNLEIDLVNGNKLSGIIVRAEERTSGFELFLRSGDGMIHFIPYHAIISAALSPDALKTHAAEASSL
jgi:CRP-like cAMP-binding protein